ncbi:hypothetical protein [Photorhabdus bodei]|uniref:Uncharacterized protein n=1 Tax=Photorhabdus bodei TaxID=2029681 RepID=A0AAW6BPM2_9GAMM|nr:hypothetical protein [Photorhabdus bodei]MDB6374716.1 hypothetical protein [Photorhabdus bodei]
MTRNSEEIFVMNVERRGHVKRPCPVSNCQTGGDAEVKAKPFVIDKRDVHRAGLLVKANQGMTGVDGRTIADFKSNLKGNLYKTVEPLIIGQLLSAPGERCHYSQEIRW